MTERWVDLFERASSYDVSAAELRDRLAADREATAGDSTDSDADEGADRHDAGGGR